MGSKIAHLEIIEASRWSHFRDIRLIRNDCRDFMTHDQEEITTWKQFGFWLYHRRMGFRVYLFRDSGRPVGYGLVRRDFSGSEWISGGVLEAERGKGYGKVVFAFLTALAEKPAYLEVFASNIRARNLYAQLDWLPFERLDNPLGTTIVMVHD